MTAHPSPASVSFREALLFWLKLGFISFGGPAGQISIMHQELVEQRRWISESQYLRALNYCMMLPGPEAQQLATYMGWTMHGIKGGIAAGVLFILPSLFILIALSWVYLRYGEVPAVVSVFYMIKAAVVAIVFQAAYRIGSRVLKNGLMRAYAIAGFAAVLLSDISFPYLVVGAAISGWILSHYWPHLFATEAHNQPDSQQSEEQREQPLNKGKPRTSIVSIMVIGIILWAVPLGMLMMAYGWEGTLTRMAWFFTKAALLTFGGAYAVLPYVFQGAVEQYHWLTSLQMMDGLALGETTPGPLIMIVTFVGFLGTAQQDFFSSSMLLSGTAGALVATFFTFLPSFIFILAGAPLVEASQFHFRLNASLAAITAINVGIIAHLGVFFAAHVISPTSNLYAIDWTATTLIAVALLLLFRFRLTIIQLMAIYAGIGIISSFF